MYYGIDREKIGQREISKIFNCSHQNISLRHLRALNSLRAIFKESYIESSKLVKTK